MNSVIRARQPKISFHKVLEAFLGGLPDDSAGWLFYVPDAKRTFISMDAVLMKISLPH